MEFRSGTSSGKAFGITTSISVPPPQSDDLNAPQISVIRATPYNSCHERNAHAHKAKFSSEEIGSNSGIEGGWREGSQDPEAEGGRHESCEYEKAESSSLEGSSDQETTGCCRRSTSCPDLSAGCPSRGAGHHDGLTLHSK